MRCDRLIERALQYKYACNQGVSTQYKTQLLPQCLTLTTPLLLPLLQY